MLNKITVKPYVRNFSRPLRTAHGEWTRREGFIVKIEQNGHIGYGEVAPIPDFGTENLTDAATFLNKLILQPNLKVPSNLPCCAFGLSAALAACDTTLPADLRNYPVSALLPAGEPGLQRAKKRIRSGYCNMKWKIGIAPIKLEISLAQRLLESLPKGQRVRFDANASLTQSQLEQWLTLLARFPKQTDYLEQPLACGQEAAMAQAMQIYGISIALDESLNGDNGKYWIDKWKGPLVIKAPLMGNVTQLATKLTPVANQIVLSSVFETDIGLANSLALADQLPQLSRPIGFDTIDAFDDALQSVKPSPRLSVLDRQNYNPELIWNLI
jgi:O-succinylbenzoate synthase